MNRRDFIKTAGMAMAAATLPIPAIDLIHHAGGAIYPDPLDEGGLFDKFLAESVHMPDILMCHPETFAELMVEYPDFSMARVTEVDIRDVL